MYLKLLDFVMLQIKKTSNIGWTTCHGLVGFSILFGIK